MHRFWVSGGGGSRCSKGLPIGASGVGWRGSLRWRARWLRVLHYLLLVAGGLVVRPAIGETVTLGWDSDPSIVGYRLYYGFASRTYPFVIDVGPANSCSVSNLVPGTPYFFAVTAYTQPNIESDFSSEITYMSGVRVASIFVDEYGTVLSWASEPGAVYRVLATPTLTNADWVDVSGPLLATSSTRLWTHIRTASTPGMFYRIEVLSGLR
jgi:hypothetical protein